MKLKYKLVRIEQKVRDRQFQGKPKLRFGLLDDELITHRTELKEKQRMFPKIIVPLHQQIQERKPGFFKSTKQFGLRFYSTIVHEYLGVKSSEELKHQLEEFKEQRLFVNGLARFVAYGGLGFGLGTLMGLSFGSLGFVGGLAVTAGLGLVPLITSKLFGEKGGSKGKMGLVFSVDSVAGELVFATTVAIVTGLSGLVVGPLSGLGVGLAAMLGGYLVGTTTFYSLWGLLNINKYRKTGFGKLSDLKQLPRHSKETVTRIWKKDIYTNGPVESESFLSEIAEIHGKGIVCALPYYLARPIVGLVAGLLYPTDFGPAFIAIYTTFSPYLFPIYANFYTLVESRVNSVVKEETDIIQESGRNPAK